MSSTRSRRTFSSTTTVLDAISAISAYALRAASSSGIQVRVSGRSSTASGGPAAATASSETSSSAGWRAGASVAGSVWRSSA